MAIVFCANSTYTYKNMQKCFYLTEVYVKVAIYTFIVKVKYLITFKNISLFSQVRHIYTVEYNHNL